MAVDEPARGPALRIDVVFCLGPDAFDQVTLAMTAGATAADAVLASELASRHRDAWPEPLLVGVWGKRVAPEHPLVDGDRVEIYRPLTVDPKEARRLRYRAQGESGRKARAGAVKARSRD